MEIPERRALGYPMPVSANPNSSATRRILKPTQLNALAKDLLESSFSQIWLEGEVSNLSRPASGHLYFTLKDTNAQVRCTLFRNRAMYLGTPLKDGQQVLVRARLTLYEARGDYQLNVESVEPAGQGELQAAFEQLKARLTAEGLFDAGRKRALPMPVKRLALLTSPRGAALHDVLSVLARRFALLPVELWPIPVQGADAAPQITASLRAAIDSHRYDAILLARGGGSPEDLWPFNDEALVRLAASSPVPVVSAIGHETDFSLLDFAADLRAPTPSAAAELLSPSGTDLQRQLQTQRQKLERAVRNHLQRSAQRMDMAQLRLLRLNPVQRLHLGRQRLQTLNLQLRRALQHELSQRLSRLKNAGGQLNALSPLATLGRGYSILRDGQRHVVQSVRQATPGQVLHALLTDGELTLRVTGDG